MYTDATTGETWRFDVRPVSPNSDETLIQRGRVYRLPSDWTIESWRNYWDGDQMVCFIDGHRDGTYAVTDNDDTERAITAFRYSASDGLARVAERAMPDAQTPAFILVHLDRDTDCWALSWDGDPEGKWRDEIEAVYHGDIWRIEVEEWDGDSWQPAEEVYAEFYGEDQATAGFEREFPLTDVPEALLVTSEN